MFGPEPTAATPAPLGLFEGYGVELEYMIVDRETLAIAPIADRLIEAVAGEIVSEVELGDVAWSNELVLHLVELKTNGPAASLDGVAEAFQQHVSRANALLEPLGARLLPTAMHPLMRPDEMRLWPHDYGEVYAAFDRIFGCRGHGWCNLQASHLNLPFTDDAEFGRLHAAVRLLLPLLPALAASSPVLEGRVTGALDTRLEVYRTNCARIPSITGQVVPEPIYTRARYEGELLAQLYRDIAPLDPDGVLQEEWLNARGAIARFDRHAIEIRVLDMQECPLADVAIARAAAAVLQALVTERFVPLAEQQVVPVAPLAAALDSTGRDGERAVIEEPALLRALGWTGRPRATAGELWAHLAEVVVRPAAPAGANWLDAFELMLRAGPLARRLLRALGPEPSEDSIREVYAALAATLAAGELWAG